MEDVLFADASKVKMEIDDGEGDGMGEMPSGFEGTPEDEDMKKVEDENRMADMMELKEVRNRRKNGLHRKDSEDSSNGSRNDAEYLKKEKVELKTFGLSSRPRRSVNYASIERGDEATAQSLLTEFTSTTKKRGKRTRDELDENYEDEPEKCVKPPKKQPVSHLRYHAAVNRVTIAKNIGQKYETELAKLLPKVDAERPSIESRSTWSTLDNEPTIRKSSGGFRRFLAWMSDELITKLAVFIEENFKLEAETDVEKMCKVVRHAWNSQSKKLRKSWEKTAKLDAYESFKLIGGATLPLSEIPGESKLEKEQRRSKKHQGADCCELKPVFNTIQDVVSHYLSSHDSVHFYGCHFCFSIYTSLSEFRSHSCEAFATYVLSLTMSGEMMEPKTAYCFLSCSDCGLWLPLRMKMGQKCWPYFSAAILAHPCKTLVPILIYFPDEVKDPNQVRLSFNVLPRLSIRVPQSCETCEIPEFSSISACEEHFKTSENHKETLKRCGRCEETFGTDWAFRLHVVQHFNHSLLFANYLKYSATFHPPQFSKRPLHFGIDKRDIIVGGFDANFSDEVECVEKYTFDEFVEPYENMIKSKLRIVIDEGKTGHSRSATPYSESDSSCSSSSSRSEIIRKSDKVIRSDLGYEHIDFSEYFDDSDKQKEAKKKCRHVIDTKLDKMFLNGERLVTPHLVLEMMGTSDEKETLDMNIAEDPLALEFSQQFLRQVDLPLASCIDPLKDFLLFNKIYYYCPDCKVVFSGDIELHDKSCSDKIIELFHPTSSASRGIKCIDPNCEERLCSAISLRCHVALRHGLFINYEMAQTSEKRYDYSITAISKHYEFLKNDGRSRMARFTDADIGMPIDGLLVKRDDSKIFNGIVEEVDLEIIKPVVEGALNFDCVWCTYSTQHLTHFQIHLGKYHLFPCDRCGKSFANKQLHRLHPCDRRFAKETWSPDMTICGSCPFCDSRFSVTMLQAHILKSHYQNVRFVKGTGQFYPVGENLRFEKPERRSPAPMVRIEATNGVGKEMRATERMKIIKCDQRPASDGILMNGTQLVAPPVGSYLYSPPSRNSADLRLTCYLCEMAFSSTQQLDEHLDKHPEKWSKCPFCRQTIRGHYDMQKHLLHSHMVRTTNAMVCEYCQIASIRSPCAHLIYQCRRLPNCGICGIPIRSYDVQVNHMTAHHTNELRRIQCSFCAQVFITMTEFYDHICHMSANLQSCACSSSKIFQTINDFCDHFDANHIQSNLTCGICRVSCHSPANLAKHRMSHMHAVSATLLRKVYLLPKWMHPQTRSVVANWGRIPAASVVPRPSVVLSKPNPNPIKKLGEITGGRSVAHVVQQNGATLNDKLQALFEHSSPPKPAQVTEIIDDDDDDDIVFEGTSSPAPAPISKTPPTQANAAVRIELDDHGASSAGQGQPGYVEDDDEIELVEASAGGSNGIEKEKGPEEVVKKIREVEDPDADDELAVVAEVENISGLTSSTIASTSREKRFKCPKCSSAFMTKASLNKHFESHRSDAGSSTSTDTFGLPLITNAYICRSCCLAFESRKKYTQHVAVHGDTQLPCKHCSGIAFNSSIIHQHLKGHEQKTVYYACGTCRLRFYSDSHLYEHLSSSHGVDLFFFCKLCGFGHTNLDKVFLHVRTNHPSDYTISQRIGCCPTTLLNFEPIDPVAFKKDVNAGKLKCYEPSDCSHRSLLLSNDALVSCTQCHCTQSLHSYVAYNTKPDAPNNSLSFIYSEPRSLKHQEFALFNFLSDESMKTMMMSGNCVPRLEGTNGSGGAPHIRMPVNRQTLSQRANEIRVGSGTRILRPVGTIPSSSSQQLMTPSGAKIVAIQRPINRIGMPNRVITNRTPGVGVTQRPVIRTGEEITFGADGLPKLGGGAVKDTCTICSRVLHNEYDRSKHKMHLDLANKWYCSRCGFVAQTENQMMLHYYKQHIAEIVASDSSLRPLSFDLICPNCNIAPFSSLKSFERHLKTHDDVLCHEAEMCGTRFATERRRDEHDRIHREHEAENGGCDATCCPICGTLDNWTMARDPTIPFILSHVSRHGLDYFTCCRICFEQFPDDNSGSNLISHFKLRHLKHIGANSMTCNCGETNLGIAQLRSHVVDKHLFHIVRQNPNHKTGLIVRAGDQLNNYIGTGKHITVREAIARGQID
ncbi:unnamed protein product [Caenorhabditis angaria]|uniref:C2H2-type domain-containing protein n=1 Tax=Caenorhabditis angaria TaxID=860376 RepID=A0A9P1MZS1_9PELO|nr:unnamed protein product [Caenorhabditis angaria]